MRYLVKRRVVACLLILMTQITLCRLSNVLVAGIISPDEMTDNTLVSLESRIQIFSIEHGSLPKALSDLPLRPDYSDSFNDGWGNAISYAPQKDGSVILTSPGAGGRNPRSLQFSIIPEEENIKGEDTRIYMDLDEKDIRDYAKAHSELPKHLFDLPGHKREEDVDGWGSPIDLSAAPDGTVTLTSHGKAGKQTFGLKFIVVLNKPATTRE